MSTQIILSQSELALAAYATLNNSALSAQKARLKDAGLSDAQADTFAARYAVLTQYTDTPAEGGLGTSFSATVFKDSSGNLTLAIRGTVELIGTPNDILPSDRDILLAGASFDQIVALWNWWQRVSHAAGTLVPQYCLTGTPTNLSQAVFIQSTVGQWLEPIISATATGTLVDVLGVDSDHKLDVTGHSLGGHLAMAFGALFASATNQVTVFNAPGFKNTVAVQTFFTSLGGSIPSGVATTNVIADEASVGSVPWSAIAALHSRLGVTVNIPIENQWQSDEANPVDARNHSQQSLTDALAVYSLLTELTPSLSSATFKSILAAATVGTAAGLERIMDMLERTFGVNTASLATGNVNRDALYQAIYGLQQNTLFQQDAGLVQIHSLASLNRDQIVALAKTDIAYRYALEQLNPFSVTGDTGLYAQHNGDGHLDADQFSDLYLQDRAAMLSWVLKAQTDDTAYNTDYLWTNGNHPDVWYFEDSSSGKLMQVKSNSVLDPNPDVHKIRFGSSAGETLMGGDVSDHLYGNAGDDTLNGGKGTDHLEGNAGSDTYQFAPGDGFDTVFDSDGQGVIRIGAVAALGSTGLEPAYWAQIGNNVWTDTQNGITYSTSVVNGEARLLIRNGDDSVVVNGWAEGELGIALGAGTPSERSTLVGQNTYSDALVGTATANLVQGLSGNDALDGSGGDDVIEGGLGDDLIAGGTGSDQIYGGAGHDMILSANGLNIQARDWNQDGVVDNQDAWISPANAGAVWSQGRLWGIYADPVEPSTLTIDGGGALQPDSAPDYIYAEDGDDMAIGGLGNDYLDGGLGNDKLWGHSGGDVISGDDGDDTIKGDGILKPGFYQTLDPALHGDDVLDGGIGNDWLYGGGKDDALFGGTGNDLLWGDDQSEADLGGQYHGNDVLDGGDGNDQLIGGGKDDVLYGGDGGDLLWGDDDDETKLPGQYHGNDTLNGGDGADQLVGGGGDDALVGGADNDLLYGDAREDGLLAAQYSGSDVLDGGDGDDNLYGGGGDDKLIGGIGNDFLDGGSGADEMAGGAGNDSYVVDDLAADGVIEAADEGNDAIYFAAKVTPVATPQAAPQAARLAASAAAVESALNTQELLNIVLPDNFEQLILNGVADVDGTGNETANSLWGNAGNNTLSGRAGNDFLMGNAGDDIYLFNRGDGQDSIDNTDFLRDSSNPERLAASDMLRFGEGIAESDVLAFRVGVDLALTLKGSIEQVAVINYFGADAVEGSVVSDHKIDRVEFANGTVWDQAMIQTVVDRAANNHAPTVNSFLPVLKATSGSAFSYSIPSGTISDPDTWDSITYKVEMPDGSVLPAWLTFDVATLTLSGFPASTDVGSLQFLLWGTDNYGAAAGQLVTLDISLPNHAPVLSSAVPDQSAIQGNSFTYSFSAGTFSDPNVGDVLSYSATLADGGALPSWLSFNAATRTLSGTPSMAGTINVRVTASDTGNLTVSDVFDIVVKAPNRAPVLTTFLPHQAALQGRLFNYTMASSAFSDPDEGDMLVYSVTLKNGSALPSWLNFDPATLTFSGTPSSLGTTLVTVTATDSGNLSVSGSFGLVVSTPGLVLTGTSRTDSLFGNSGADVINGLGGDDYIAAGSGDDSLLGGDGNDRIYGEAGNDHMHGEAGGDELQGGLGSDVLYGGTGNDRLLGGDGNDVYLFGRGDGFDSIGDSSTAEGTSSADTLRLGSGILPEHVSFHRMNKDLMVVIDGSNQQIRLMDYFYVDLLRMADASIDIIEFDGGAGPIWSKAEISARVEYGVQNSMNGSTSDDTFIVDHELDVIIEAADSGSDTVLSSRTYVLQSNVENLTLTGFLNINANGNSLNNELRGNSGDNIFEGGGGSDVAYGGPGNDIYTNVVPTEMENEGIDTLIGLKGSTNTWIDGVGTILFLPDQVENWDLKIPWGLRSIYYSVAGNDLDNILISEGNGFGSTIRFNGTVAGDILDGRGGADTVIIRGYDEPIVYIDNPGDIVIGKAFEIRSSIDHDLSGSTTGRLVLIGDSPINATGNELSNLLAGNIANNTLSGGAGADTMIGGLGDDTYIVDNPGDIVTERINEGIDLVQASVTTTLFGNVEKLTLTGGNSINGTGNVLDNVLIGNSANNTLSGGAGIDSHYGGQGDDTYIVDNTGDTVIEFANEGTDTIESSLTWTLGANLENLTLTGTAAINGSGNALNNRLAGNGANNTLSGLLGNDTLHGGAGNDWLSGGSGADVLDGGEGIDTAAYGDSNLGVVVDLALNTASGGSAEGDSFLGIENLRGSINTDTLIGNAGNNTLDGGAGMDTLHGGAGNDTYIVDNPGDTLTEHANEGTDSVQSTLSWTLGSNFENLTLTGTAAINGTGNELANALVGNAASNILSGGAGNDWLVGGAGADVLDGGDGADTASYSGSNLGVLANLAFNSASGGHADGDSFIGIEHLRGSIHGDTLIGNSGNNSLVADSGSDQLQGGAGNDNLQGGLGNDTYLFNRGDGVDAWIENDATFGNLDIARFGADIAHDQLWFRKIGNDLETRIIGTSDRTLVKNWYSGDGNHIERFEAGDGRVLLDSQIDNLVQAMAAFAPPAAGQTTLPGNYHDALASVLAVNWQ
jgi:Ca2+-binding RTX toxin-like protein